MSFKKRTEEISLHRNLEQKSTLELLSLMNAEDQKVALAVEKCIPEVAVLVECAISKLKEGGRLFYIGAGTSGRLGILDASECPPTFGVSQDMIQGIIAGGDQAIRKAVEFAEDSKTQAWDDLKNFGISKLDLVIGIAASGTTPYVLYGLQACQKNQIKTACITSNPGSPITEYSDFKIEVLVGPEFITGSSRLKSGTAQKLLLNMISTTIMIGLGRVVDHKMVDMQLNNQKLIERGVRMIVEESDLNEFQAKELLLKVGSVRAALLSCKH
ncbi:MAG: N-acetylmuramic acid 6-phosphate etherase [Saprospiraceae bacterium]